MICEPQLRLSMLCYTVPRYRLSTASLPSQRLSSINYAFAIKLVIYCWRVWSVRVEIQIKIRRTQSKTTRVRQPQTYSYLKTEIGTPALLWPSFNHSLLSRYNVNAEFSPPVISHQACLIHFHLSIVPHPSALKRELICKAVLSQLTWSASFTINCLILQIFPYSIAWDKV